MIDRKKAIEELNNKICFISQQYADSDRSVKDILNNAKCDFMATEGEIATLLEYDPLVQIKDKLQSLYNNLYLQRAKLVGKTEIIEAIYQQILELENNDDDSPKPPIMPYLSSEQVDEIKAALSENNPPVVTSRGQISEAEKYLAAYISNTDETQHVLQELIYMLFNTELYSNQTLKVHCNIEPME